MDYMRILVDADAAPVKDIIEIVAKDNNIEVIMYIDTSHEYESDSAKVIMVSKGRDSVDFKIIKDVMKDDLVITNDYALASLALLKGAKCISYSGLIYNDYNINVLLIQRQFNQKLREHNKRGSKIKKRTKKDDDKFKEILNKVICE
jgi:uncharacterized protein YaiI (UPF0178 family)